MRVTSQVSEQNINLTQCFCEDEVPDIVNDVWVSSRRAAGDVLRE